MAEFLWIFWSFSLLGWGLERLFAAVTRSPQRRRRCLLLLPLCPVYGLGMAAVLALPPESRAVVVLFYYEDLPTEEIARIVGTSPGAVRVRLSRAREKLRSILKEGDYG